MAELRTTPTVWPIGHSKCFLVSGQGLFKSGCGGAGFTHYLTSNNYDYKNS